MIVFGCELSIERIIVTASIAPLLDNRWSPRGFKPSYELGQSELMSILEAAQWAPSASNTQPWAFIAARRGTPQFDAIAAALAGFNQVWAPRASALIVFCRVAERAGKMTRWVDYDLGQAAAHATVQAAQLGLYVHQMGGFDVAAISAAFQLPAGTEPMTVMAVGSYDDSPEVPDEIRGRDGAERSRLPLATTARVY